MKKLIEIKQLLAWIMLVFIVATTWSCSDDKSEEPDDPANNETVDPQLRPFIGTWLATDGEEEIQASFFADGTYSDVIISGGKQIDAFTGIYKVKGNTIWIPNSNIYNCWGEEYQYNFKTSSAMTLTNDLMKSWGCQWNLTRISTTPKNFKK